MADFFSDLKDILFLDIETASSTAEFGELPPRLQEEWIRKISYFQKENTESPDHHYFEKAGIYAEFGKVVCIGVGFFAYNPEEETLQFRAKTFGEPSERDTLLGFIELLEKKDWTLCAHNGKEFDFPYLCRRILANRIPLPEVLKLAGKKPWEIRHLDTMELWKFGDYKHYTRLELLAALFDIPSSKGDIDGSQVNDAYYRKNDLASIRHYCQRDVWVTAQIYLAFQGLPADLEIQFLNRDEEGGDIEGSK